MSKQSTRKIQISTGVTERQMRLLQSEAKRLDISVGDKLRRIIDEWAEKLAIPTGMTKDPRTRDMYNTAR